MFAARRVHAMIFLVLMLQTPFYMSARGANILLSGVYGEGSHFAALVPIGKSLWQQGHNVTFLIGQEYSFRAQDPDLNKMFSFEIFSYDEESFTAKEFFRLFAEIGKNESNGLLQMVSSLNVGKKILVDGCASVLGDEAMMKRFESIDAIVSEMPWPCGAYIKSYLTKHSNNSDVRLIISSATTVFAPMLTMAGSPYNIAFQPVGFTSYNPSMTISQRIINSLYLFGVNSFTDLMISSLSELIEKFDLHSYLKSKHTFHQIIDLYLMNVDFAVEFPLPLTSNIIAVGGLTAEPAEPLSQDLEEFMQSSGDHGVVVFAMGSYFASFTSYRTDILQMFLDAFSRIPQKVIMQLKDPPTHGLPQNVKSLPWLPQNDLLGHPKTKVFVSHAGNNGFLEAVYHGVPMVVIPLFGDHLDVTARVLYHGLGVKIDKDRVSAELIHRQLVEVLGNAEYGKTAKRLSAVFQDRPLKPADRAAFWINHVIKHGSDHLRPIGFHELSFIQYYVLDVMAFWTLTFCVLLYFSYRALKCLYQVCNQRNESKNKRD